MKLTIRKMAEQDRDCVLNMMGVFYASPAVLSNGSPEIFINDIEACISDSPYLEGYILEDAGTIIGYAMVARSFSTEFGKPCAWIEDLYVKDAYRGCGIGSQVLEYISGLYADHVIRLEVEAENERAVRVYKKNGFRQIPYMEMIKGI